MKEASRFLNSIHSQYPRGIPQALLREHWQYLKKVQQSPVGLECTENAPNSIEFQGSSTSGIAIILEGKIPTQDSKLAVEKITHKEIDLLYAAIEKGLKIERHLTLIVAIRSLNSVDQIIPLLVAHKIKVAIVIGNSITAALFPEVSCKRGVPYVNVECSYISTHTLSDVCQSTTMKKEFWQDLQVANALLKK